VKNLNEDATKIGKCDRCNEKKVRVIACGYLLIVIAIRISKYSVKGLYVKWILQKTKRNVEHLKKKR
jgi:hypothetical protein